MHIRWPVAGVVALYVQLLIEKLWELTLVQLAPCRSVSVSLHSSGINFKGIHTTPSVRRERQGSALLHIFLLDACVLLGH